MGCDSAVVEWRDEATAVRDGSGNITLRIDRAGAEDYKVCLAARLSFSTPHSVPSQMA
jgi:hypothetical protein